MGAGGWGAGCAFTAAWAGGACIVISTSAISRGWRPKESSTATVECDGHVGDQSRGGLKTLSMLMAVLQLLLALSIFMSGEVRRCNLFCRVSFPRQSASFALFRGSVGRQASWFNPGIPLVFPSPRGTHANPFGQSSVVLAYSFTCILGRNWCLLEATPFLPPLQ